MRHQAGEIREAIILHQEVLRENSKNAHAL